MRGELIQNHHRVRVGVTASANSARVAFSIGPESFEVITVPGSAYIRADRQFWVASRRAGAAIFAGQWVQIPALAARRLTAFLGPLVTPSTMARCLTEDHGILSFAGKTSINGRNATLIKDAGDVPGATPEVLAVAAAGRPYPLRLTATGAGRPGGRIDVCNNGQANDARGAVTLSDFGNVHPVTPAQHAAHLQPATSD